jgi:replication factor C small subunit
LAQREFDLLVEKYRPKTLDGYVFKNDKMKAQIHEWLENSTNKRIPFPHLLLSGSPGVGKTSLAKIFCNEFKIQPGDILFINASRERGIDMLRDQVVGFCTTWPIGEYRVIILDEMDALTPDAQKAFRGEMERYADSVRFIGTCNYSHKILPALHSRFQGFHIDKLDFESFFERMIDILDKESIKYNDEIVYAYAKAAYPDLRKAINSLDQNIRNSELHTSDEEVGSTADYLLDMVGLYRAGKVTEARKLVCAKARPEEFESIYRYFYQHLDMFSQTEEGQAEAIIEIARGLRDHAVVADVEINLAAVLIKLSRIQN